MTQVVDFFRKLLDTSDFPARWNCGKWTDFHGWFYIISNLLVWSAYFAIPVIIIRYTSRQKNIRFHNAYFLFAAFILACGLTHFLDAIMFWYPLYRLNALMLFITAIASWLTVLYLYKILPTAFAYKSPMELEREVEQRRLAEEELIIKNKQLNEAQDIAKLGYWEWTVSTNLLEWSHGMYKVFGIEEGQKMTYETFMEHIYPDDRASVDSLINDCFKTKVFPEYYHRLIGSNGEIKTIHAKGELLLDGSGQVIKMLGTGQDVTEQKKSEKELIIKTKELENVNEELEKFAYVASHDLQEPLRKLITYTSLLNAEYKDQLEGRGAGYIDKITTSSVRMQNLIHDILNLSRLSSEDIQFEKVDLNMAVQQALADMEVIIESSGATINLDVLPVIEANGVKMQQLFLNLISNSIKFRNAGKAPIINVTSSIISGNQLPGGYFEKIKYRFPLSGGAALLETEKFCRVTVSDNGIGFNKEYEHKIFEVFQRLQTKNRREGTGIGLAICKKIVESHHGVIWAKSKEGEGSSFTLLLPLTQKNFKLSDEISTRNVGSQYG